MASIAPEEREAWAHQEEIESVIDRLPLAEQMSYQDWTLRELLAFLPLIEELVNDAH